MTTNSTWAALRNPAFRKDFAGGCLNEGRELEKAGPLFQVTTRD